MLRAGDDAMRAAWKRRRELLGEPVAAHRILRAEYREQRPIRQHAYAAVELVEIAGLANEGAEEPDAAVAHGGRRERLEVRRALRLGPAVTRSAERGHRTREKVQPAIHEARRRAREEPQEQAHHRKLVEREGERVDGDEARVAFGRERRRPKADRSAGIVRDERDPVEIETLDESPHEVRVLTERDVTGERGRPAQSRECDRG